MFEFNIVSGSFHEHRLRFPRTLFGVLTRSFVLKSANVKTNI
jgi:hypothetical protein